MKVWGPLSLKMLHIPDPFVVVLLQSCVRLSVTPWTAACQVPLPFTISWSLLKLMSIELVMPSNHLILCCPLLLLPSIFPRIRVFSNKSALHIWWPKYCSFSFSISPSSEYSRLISFRMDWFDLLAVPGTLKSLLQHHSLKASILWRSAFFVVQLAHPYLTTRKTIALNIQNMTSLPWQMEIHPKVSWVYSTHSCNLTPIQHVPIDTSCISLLQVQSLKCWYQDCVSLSSSLYYSFLFISFSSDWSLLLVTRWMQHPKLIFIALRKHHGMALTVKNLPAMQETQARSLGWEDPLEKGMATHPSIIAWIGGAWQATVHGVAESWTWLLVTDTFHFLPVGFPKCLYVDSD